MAGAEACVVWQRRRAAAKHCVLHEDAKHSPDLSHFMPCCCIYCQADKTYHGDAKVAEQKDLFDFIDEWSYLDSRTFINEKTSMHWEKNSLQKDLISDVITLDEILKAHSSVCDTFDIINSEDVSIPDNVEMIEAEEGAPTKLDFVCEEVANWIKIISDQTPRERNVHSKESLTSMSNNELNSTLFLEKESKHKPKEVVLNSFREFNCMQNVLTPPKFEKQVKASWRSANAKELAALVAHKAKEHLENCDLPPSRSPSIYKGHLESCDLLPAKSHRLDISRSMDQDPWVSLLCGFEPTQIECKPLPPSPLILGFAVPSLPRSFSRLSHQQVAVSKGITLSKQEEAQLSSLETKAFSWNGLGHCLNDSDCGSELFGKALCHSQTRAREAETAAAQAFLEKDKLTRLLFRQTSLSFTYRQWINALQAENTSLRLHVKEQPATRARHDFINPCITYKYLSDKHLKRKQQLCKDIKKPCTGNGISKRLKPLWSTSRSDIIVGCTLGLAFAFGLSLVGAGLMLGWSIGFIFSAY